MGSPAIRYRADVSVQVRDRSTVREARERTDTEQLKLEFAQKLRELDELRGMLGIAKEAADELDGSGNDGKGHSDDDKASDGKPRGKRTNNAGTGRRNLRDLPLEEERIEIPDPHLEKLVEGATSFVMASMRRPSREVAEIAAPTLALPDAQSVEDLTALLSSAGER